MGSAFEEDAEQAVNVPGMSNSSTVQDLCQALILLWGWASDRQLVALEVTCHIWLSWSDPPSDPAMTRLTVAALKICSLYLLELWGTSSA